VTRRLNQVAPIKSRCLAEHRCSPQDLTEYSAIEKIAHSTWNGTHNKLVGKYEMKKPYPDCYLSRTRRTRTQRRLSRLRMWHRGRYLRGRKAVSLYGRSHRSPRYYLARWKASFSRSRSFRPGRCGHDWKDSALRMCWCAW